MPKLIEAIIHDLKFIRSHTLQPQWYKILKVFLLLGLLVGYYLIFGPTALLIFAAIFFGLSLVVHMLYRVKTHTWTQSWLDFIVVDGQPRQIGRFYYTAVLVNIALGVVVSLLLS